jgi:hydroxymethylbilane synthase
MTVPHPDRLIRFGTRASPLAMAQARMTAAALIAAHGWADDAVELVPMVASGDRILDRKLAEVGGKALWTRELDVALDGGTIDASVHSMKDVETIRHDAFIIAAMLPRADVRDRLVGADSIDALPHGAVIGTASPRRTAQLLRLRPDLKMTLLRGNVGTRLGKIADGEADATLLAAAGLDRLDMADTGVAVPTDMLLPAPSQGAVGIECRTDDARMRALLAAIDDAPTHACVAVERALLLGLGGDCRSPVAALAQIGPDGAITLHARIYAANGSAMIEDQAVVDGPAEAMAMARRMLAAAPPPIAELFTGMAA